jgi:hypothetical protein
MILRSIHPGVTLDMLKANTGFELILPAAVETTEPPTIEQIDLIRTKIDPHGWCKNMA